MPLEMKTQNKKRMKMVAQILGTITFFIILLAIYKLFIARH